MNDMNIIARLMKGLVDKIKEYGPHSEEVRRYIVEHRNVEEEFVDVALMLVIVARGL